MKDVNPDFLMALRRGLFARVSIFHGLDVKVELFSTMASSVTVTVLPGNFERWILPRLRIRWEGMESMVDNLRKNFLGVTGKDRFDDVELEYLAEAVQAVADWNSPTAIPPVGSTGVLVTEAAACACTGRHEVLFGLPWPSYDPDVTTGSIGSGERKTYIFRYFRGARFGQRAIAPQTSGRAARMGCVRQ